MGEIIALELWGPGGGLPLFNPLGRHSAARGGGKKIIKKSQEEDWEGDQEEDQEVDQEEDKEEYHEMDTVIV